MKLILLRYLLFSLILTLFSFHPVQAWDEVGHKITAYIAWQHMNQGARDRVFSIIMDAPEDSDLSKVYDRFNSRTDKTKRLEQFMFASIWPDVVKNRDFENRNKKYDQGNWHYAGIFWKQENGQSTILKDFKGAGGLAVPKLSDFDRIMSGSSYPSNEKALAIAWFLHVGGDLHNPLHNASRVTDTEPTGDQGGNLFILEPRTENSRGTRLHAYWDSIIGRVKPRKDDIGDVKYISKLAKGIMKKYKFREFSGELKLGDYKGWNAEGFGYLNDYVYEGVTRNQLPSKKYRKRTYKLARRQLALAGYRLGETLNKYFDVPKGVSAADCRIIQKVLYPVSKKRLPNQKPTLALIDICPANRGMVARPVTQLGADSPFYEYDVVRTFKNADEAKTFARKNRITKVHV